MSIIERGARALAKAQSGVDEWDSLEPSLQQALMNEVRAVLLGVREPSEELVASASEAEPEDSQPGAWDYPERKAAAQWRAMIDAALKEEE